MTAKLEFATNDIANNQTTPRLIMLGIILQFLSTPEQNGTDTAFLSGTLPAGAVIPLHRHEDPEVLYVLKVSIQVYQETTG